MTQKQSYTEKMRVISSALEPEAAHVKLVGLKGSAPAFLMAGLSDGRKSPLLVVAPTAESAEEILREARFYSAHPASVYYFPAWEISPFEQASPHPDVSGERLNTLFALMEGKASIVVLPVSSLLQRVLPRSVLADHSQETDRHGRKWRTICLEAAPTFSAWGQGR